MYLLQDSFEILNFASKQDLKWDMVFCLAAFTLNQHIGFMQPQLIYA